MRRGGGITGGLPTHNGVEDEKRRGERADKAGAHRETTAEKLEAACKPNTVVRPVAYKALKHVLSAMTLQFSCLDFQRY